MLAKLNEGKWHPVELVGWTRRAYGRRIMLESEGGTLRTSIGLANMSDQLYLQGEIIGRMLIQVYCDGRMVFDELASNTELDSFIDLELRGDTSEVELELHLIPATFGEVKIPQLFKTVQIGGNIPSILHSA